MRPPFWKLFLISLSLVSTLMPRCTRNCSIALAKKTLILTASTHQSQISLSCKLEKVSGSHSVPGLIWPLTSLTWLFHAFPNRWRPRPQLDDGPQSMVEVLGHQPLGPWVAQHHTASLHAGTTETYHMYQYLMLYDLLYVAHYYIYIFPNTFVDLPNGMQNCNNIWLGMGTLYAATAGQSPGVARTYIYIYIL